MSRIRVLVGGLIVIAAMFMAMAASSQALVGPSPINPSGGLIPAANYQGWAYVSASGSTANAWRWTQAGWASATFNVGSSVSAYPWSDVWTWAYKGGSWYAFKRSQLRVWSCAPLSGGDNTILNKTPVYKYNSRSSELLGFTRSGTRGCGNTFWEADLQRYAIPMCLPGSPCPDAFGEQYILAWVNPQPSCTIPETPTSPICMIAVRNNPRWAYVPMMAISQVIGQPPPAEPVQ